MFGLGKPKKTKGSLGNRIATGQVSRREAQEILGRAHKRRLMRAGGNGFRMHSSRHDTWDIWDKLYLLATGSINPLLTRNYTRKPDSETRQRYLEAVRNNPKYPKGDRRLKA